MVGALMVPGTAVAATVPGPPVGVHGVYTSLDGERVTVAWSPPANDGGGMITAYQVQASEDGTAWSVSRTVESDCTGCLPESSVRFSYELTVYDTYVFRVAARNSSGWGDWSALSPPFTVLPGNLPRVSPPQDLVAKPVLGGITMDWREPAGGSPVTYRVEWTRDGGGHWNGSDWTRRTAYEFTGLVYGTYLVRVRTERDEVQTSVWVTSAQVVVPDRRQRIKNFTGLPACLASPGKTRLVPCGLITNAGQSVRVRVTWEPTSGRGGDSDAVIVRRRACGKVVVTLDGTPVTVVVTLRAPAVGRYDNLRITRTYRP